MSDYIMSNIISYNNSIIEHTYLNLNVCITYIIIYNFAPYQTWKIIFVKK